MSRVSPATFLPATILSAALLSFALPKTAHAIRFSLGVGANITPLSVDVGDFPQQVRLGLRPVLDIEFLPWLSIDTYAPFTVYRTGDDGPASGAESVFGMGVAGRYRLFDPDTKIERLWYGRLRGGFTTVDGRAGPFYGLAAGYAVSWLDTGRGVFAELEAGRAQVAGRPGDAARPEIDRWLFGVSIGVVFRLGGERWDL